MAMADAFKIAKFFTEMESNPQSVEARAQALEKDIVTRGRKAVLESRNAAKQFHNTSRMQQMLRNIGFRMGNVFIRMATKK